jgi:iron(III) transport system ATP-binding protein
MIAGFEEPTAGKILLLGQDVSRLPAYERDVNTVFQDYALFPHMTVLENVCYGLRALGMRQRQAAEKAAEKLSQVGLSGYERRLPSELSGGQQQRVAVARAIVLEPKVLLFDEPLSNLDAKLRDRTRAEIRRLQRTLHVAAVYVTHDQAEALSLSDRILVMQEGRIRQQGTPEEIYAAPRDMFVADVVGAANFLDVDIEAVDAGGIVARTQDGSAIRARGSAERGTGRVLVRPDRMTIEMHASQASGVNRLHGQVRQRLFLGGHFEYAVAVGDTLLRVLSTTQIEEGAAVVICFSDADTIALGNDMSQP